jgi:hypothetical protein
MVAIVKWREAAWVLTRQLGESFVAGASLAAGAAIGMAS